MDYYRQMEPEQESWITSSGQEYYTLIVADPEELTGHFPLLENLATEAVEPNIFLEPWLLHSAIQSYSKVVRLVLILIYMRFRNGKDKSPLLCGFVPLQEKKYFYGLPIKSLSIWRYPHCYLSTPLLHRDHIEHCVQALISWFKSQHKYKVLKMPLISANGKFHGTLEQVLQVANLQYASNYFERAMINSHTDSNADEYLAKAISGKSMRAFRRYQRRLAELGDLSWDEFTVGNPKQWIDEFLHLESSGWKGREGTALAASEVDKQFFTSMIREACSRNRLIILALRLNSRPITMIVILLTKGGGFTFKMAFDETYRKYSPGVLLIMELVRRIYQHPGIHWLDSCADHDNAMVNRFFLQKRLMRNVIISNDQTVGSWIVRAYPYLRKIKKLSVFMRFSFYQSKVINATPD